jgi:DNA-binding NarL/FixJ family response regulator
MKSWRILLVEPDSSRCTSLMNEFAKLPGIDTARCLESLQDLRALDADGDFPFEAALLGAAVSPKDVLSSIRWLRRAEPACRIIVFAVPEESSLAIEFFEAGAWAVLSDRVSARELRQCLAAAARGEAVLSTVMAGMVLRRIRHLSLVRLHTLPTADALQSLTRREREILTLIARRLSNQEIARELVVEVGTVKNHVHSVLKKLGVASRYEAAAFGLETAALAEREAA